MRSCYLGLPRELDHVTLPNGKSNRDVIVFSFLQRFDYTLAARKRSNRFTRSLSTVSMLEQHFDRRENASRLPHQPDSLHLETPMKSR